MSVASLSGQSITIYPQGTRDKYNKLTWGTGVANACRFQKVSQVMLTANRESEPIDGIAIINGNPTVEVGDKAVYSGDNYKVMSKKENIDGRGNVHHVTLKVQKWSTG